MSGGATGGGLGTSTLAWVAGLGGSTATSAGNFYTPTVSTSATTWTWSSMTTTPQQAAQLQQLQHALVLNQMTLAQMQASPNPQLQQGGYPSTYPGNPVVRNNPALRPNPFLAASDLLEDFIAYVAPHGVTKAAFRKLPLELFIQWLVLESAKADGEDTAELPDPAQLLLADQRRMVAGDLAAAP